MNPFGPLPLKNVGLYILLIFGGLLSAYITFVGLISIWIGLRHSQQDGFWMPILLGALFIITIVLFFARLTNFVRNQMREKDIIEVQG
jgi:hypothetical protein